MSDRESFRRVSKHGVNAPKSDGECSEASCELIRMLPVLLKERVRSPQGMERHPGSVPKMIEIRSERSTRPTGLTPRCSPTMVSARGPAVDGTVFGVDAQVLPDH